MTHRAFVPGYHPDTDPARALYVVLDQTHGVLSGATPEWQPLPSDAVRFLDWQPEEQHHIGYFADEPVFAVRLPPQSPVPDEHRWESLRDLLARGAVGPEEFAMAGAALQVFNWDQSHQFCGRCGQATHYHPAERARVCEACGIHYYPRLSPCVITLITRGDECLLASHHKHRGAFHSPIAGFIEPGESIEGALRREVAEEVSLEVTDLQYFGSQPWPFPGQLMIGFHARYAAGEIRVDDDELAEANWWHYSRLPRVPRPGSLSGMLIEHFVNQCRRAE